MQRKLNTVGYLLDASILAHHPLNHWLVDYAHDNSRDQAAREGPKPEEAYFGRSKEVRGRGEDTGEDDLRSDVPGRQDTRGHDSVAGSRASQSQERTEEKLDNIVVRVHARKDGERLEESLLLRDDDGGTDVNLAAAVVLVPSRDLGSRTG